jgi:hypothetical protein
VPRGTLARAYDPPVTSTLDVIMRPELMEPVQDQEKLRQLLPLAEEVFRLHEAGQSYAQQLKEISRLAGRIVGQHAVLAAFGTADHEYFARKLLIDWDKLPTDLTRAEMLEVLEQLCAVTASPDIEEYWLKVLEVNTGDDQLTNLIYWPGIYFGDSYDGRELSPAKMLEVALARRSE